MLLKKKKKVKLKYDFQTWMVNKLNFFDLINWSFWIIYFDLRIGILLPRNLMHRRPSFYTYRMLTLLVLSVFETIYSMIWILAFQVMLATQNEQVKALGKGIHVFFKQQQKIEKINFPQKVYLYRISAHNKLGKNSK